MGKSAKILAVLGTGTGKTVSQVGPVTSSAGMAAAGKHKQPL